MKNIILFLALCLSVSLTAQTTADSTSGTLSGVTLRIAGALGYPSGSSGLDIRYQHWGFSATGVMGMGSWTAERQLFETFNGHRFYAGAGWSRTAKFPVATLSFETADFAAPRWGVPSAQFRSKLLVTLPKGIDGRQLQAGLLSQLALDPDWNWLRSFWKKADKRLVFAVPVTYGGGGNGFSIGGGAGFQVSFGGSRALEEVRKAQPKIGEAIGQAEKARELTTEAKAAKEKLLLAKQAVKAKASSGSLQKRIDGVKSITLVDTSGVQKLYTVQKVEKTAKTSWRVTTDGGDFYFSFEGEAITVRGVPVRLDLYASEGDPNIFEISNLESTKYVRVKLGF